MRRGGGGRRRAAGSKRKTRTPHSDVGNNMIQGKFRSQTSEKWTDEKQRWEESEKRRERRKKIKEEKFRRKKIQAREKVGKSRFTGFFPMMLGSGGSKSRLAKAAGAEPAGQMRDGKLHAVVVRSTFASEKVKKKITFGPFLEVAMSKKCTPLWREAHFEVKMYKNASCSDHFWKLRCRKSARCCGAKHISKSKV